MLLKLQFLTTLTFSIFSLAFTSQYSLAQENTSDLQVQIDVGQLKASKLGSQLIDFAKSQAQEEMGDKLNWEDVQKSLGFDPIEEITSINVATSFESPDTSAVVSVNFKNTTGNLEGLMLATPNYETTKIDNHTVHSADLDGKRIYAVIVSNPQGGKTAHLSLNQSNIKQILDSKTTQTLSSSDLIQKGKIVQVNVKDFPVQMLGDGPHTNIVKLIKGLNLAAGETSNDFEIDLNITVVDEERAEQIRQVAEGLMGALSLATSMDNEDQDLAKIKDIVKSLNAKRSGDKVNVNLVVDGDQVTQAIANELNK